MNFSEILLIILSSAGLLHGALFATYLCFIKKKRSLTNILLGLILYFMAFRIGKSVLLNFGNDLEPIFIFAGLAFILAIGPLLRWYVCGMTRANFKLPKYYLIELVPFISLLFMSFFVTKNWFDIANKQVIFVFGSILIFIYLHLAGYIFWSWKRLQDMKNEHQSVLLTKSQKAVFNWLQLLIFGFVAVWLSYCLNIIDNLVPYVTGPIVYSLVIYFLSYKAFQLKVMDIDGTVFKENNDAALFKEISRIVIAKKLYLDSQVTLTGLAKEIGKTSQKTSEIINQYANQNFNDFINFYRIQEAKRLLLDDVSKSYTIASIAFDIGFSSLSSFNSAFKKFESKTPSEFRRKT